MIHWNLEGAGEIQIDKGIHLKTSWLLLLYEQLRRQHSPSQPLMAFMEHKHCHNQLYSNFLEIFQDGEYC